MVGHHDELLRVAGQLLDRRPKQRGRLADACVRRSISTTYYALFHFLTDEAGKALIGTHHDLRRRRRIFGRVLTHAGMKAALEKVRGVNVDQAISDFLRPRSGAAGPVPSPSFARSMAAAFSDAQAKRHDADYNLDEPLSELDARRLLARVAQVIAAWRSATTIAEKDFKHAIFMLLVLKGQLRTS
jgi:hypothetical protein